MFNKSNFKIMETNVQITAHAKEFKNGQHGFEVLVQGMDNKLNCSMNFIDPLKAMRYMFMLSKKLELQIDKIELAALSLAYKRIKDATKEVVETAEMACNEVAEANIEQKEVKTEEVKEETIKLTPMTKQFYDLKAKHPDATLLFRCGDFYETYCEDAKVVSEILGITLTRSSKSVDAEGKPLEMAGFPYHALDVYLPKLIRAGKRVAICDQIERNEEPAKKQITDLVTPAEQPKKRGRKPAKQQEELPIEVAE